MIVKMKKVHLVVESKEVEATLNQLSDLGVVHVEHMAEFKGHSLAGQKEDVAVVKRVVDLLNQSKTIPPQEECANALEKCRDIDEMRKDVIRFKESVAKRAIRIQKWEPWGNFDPEDIRKLIAEDVYVQLFEIPVAELETIPDDVVCEVIYQESGIARCVLVLRENIVLPYERVYMPPMSLVEEKNIQTDELAKIRDLKTAIEANAKYLDVFENELHVCLDRLRFNEVKIGMKEQEELSVLKGFCPVDDIEILKKKALEQKWGVLVEDISDEDRVPTLLRNPKWVDMIKPVFNMIDILPGFKEADISIFFLVFFSIFFGILIGDAGYGTIFFLSTFFAQQKWGRRVKDKSIFSLMYVLSGCTIIWGILTGTFFGQAWLPAHIKPLLPWLRDDNNIQMLCFLIGAIHLSLAHGWRAMMRLPSPTALSEVGWLFMLWGMFFTAKTLVLSLPFPEIGKWLLVGGATLIVFFTKPNMNPLKAIGPGIGDFLLNVINTFTDIVSYIRLFAVGLATVAVADAFNKMALGFGFGDFVAGLITALILVAGHLFNIILCAMAILVHGIRLNVLEFSGHMNMEWSGFRYNPFKKMKKA